MYSHIEFSLNPRLHFYNDDFYKTIKFNNKKLDKKLKDKIIKDFLSPKFKKILYEDIFNMGSNDINDISQYLDGKILEVKYNNNKSNFTVKSSLFLSKSLPKDYSSINKKDLLNKDEIIKLLTKKNIIEMIKENINHVYRARGYYKDFKFEKYEVYPDLSLISENDKYVINNFNFMSHY